MFQNHQKDLDVVFVATPDHSHFAPSMTAVSMGIHCYTEKPLTWSVREAQLLAAAYKKNPKVVTQMGNQGASGEGVNLISEWLANNEIGEVTKVEAFTDRPIWPQGQPRPSGMDVPGTLDWDLFIGPAKTRPYNAIYTPWNWRGWWDFGTGALGDMACHILHPVFVGLELGLALGTCFFEIGLAF